MNDKQPSPWLTTREACAYLGISRATLDVWAGRGAVKKHRVRGSRLIRFRRDELDAALRPKR